MLFIFFLFRLNICWIFLMPRAVKKLMDKMIGEGKTYVTNLYDRVALSRKNIPASQTPTAPALPEEEPLTTTFARMHYSLPPIERGDWTVLEPENGSWKLIIFQIFRSDWFFNVRFWKLIIFHIFRSVWFFNVRFPLRKVVAYDYTSIDFACNYGYLCQIYFDKILIWLSVAPFCLSSFQLPKYFGVFALKFFWQCTFSNHVSNSVQAST